MWSCLLGLLILTSSQVSFSHPGRFVEVEDWSDQMNLEMAINTSDVGKVIGKYKLVAFSR